MSRHQYDDGEHEFVGMDMCIYCGECKQLLLQPEFFKAADGNMYPKKGIKRIQSTSPEPCDACKKKFEEEGVVPVYEATRGKQGPIFGKRYIFIARESVKGKEFIEFMNKHGFLICEPEVIDHILQHHCEGECSHE